MHCDFSYKHYREILQSALDAGYQFISYEEAESKNAPDKYCILRHDIDYRPDLAGMMGDIEHALGIRSTYFYQIVSRIYNVRETENLGIIRKLSEQGHDLGIHLDLTWDEDVELSEIGSQVSTEQSLFKALTGVSPVEMISFHNPHRFQEQILNSPIPGIRHSYEKPLFSDIKYLSDSQGWYEGCMCKVFSEARYPKIQFLTHPYIWSITPEQDFIADMGKMISDSSNHLFEYLVKYHPKCAEQKERLREHIKQNISRW